MPTRDQHLKQAKDNEEFAERLLRSADNPSIAWAATTIFYSAHHYRRAFLAVSTTTQPKTHVGFETTFRRSWTRSSDLLQHYRRLKLISERARYDCVEYSIAEILKLRDDHLHPFGDAILAALGVP
jgi:uncharacterized protein (UPF0332 family)